MTSCDGNGYLRASVIDVTTSYYSGMDTPTVTPNKPKPIKIRMVCLECGKTKFVSPNTQTELRCSCGSVDLDVA